MEMRNGGFKCEKKYEREKENLWGWIMIELLVCECFL